MKKQLFPILLSLVMVLMLLPSPALAVNGEGASIMFLPPAAPATDKLSEVLSGEVVQLWRRQGAGQLLCRPPWRVDLSPAGGFHPA